MFSCVCSTTQGYARDFVPKLAVAPQGHISSTRGLSTRNEACLKLQVLTSPQVIYDVDGAHVLMRPEEGVPFAETASAEHELSFFSRPSTGVHNPYPCFGAAGVVWPRGFPPAKIRDKTSSMCGVVMDGGGAGEQRVGVVQTLADNNPDVDALYRMTCAPGGSPLSFVEESPPLPGSSLRLVPASTFSPYNAKVIPATLGATVGPGIEADVFVGFALWREAWADIIDRAGQRQKHTQF